MLSPEERQRYDRQIIMPEIGEAGQEKLKKARVVIVGAGGLGSSIATPLAAAGIGRIRIIDHDTIELSNLNRQFLHSTADLGRPKVTSAVEKLRKLNPDIEIEGLQQKIDESNVSQLVAGFDLIVDALDNLPTRYLLNRTALAMKLPFFHGAVNGFEGRAMTILPGQSACLWCIYRGAQTKGKVPVLGVAPAVIGAIQATEVIKYICGIKPLLTNRLLIYDGRTMTMNEINVKQNLYCEECGPGASARTV